MSKSVPGGKSVVVPASRSLTFGPGATVPTSQAPAVEVPEPLPVDDTQEQVTDLPASLVLTNQSKKQTRGQMLYLSPDLRRKLQIYARLVGQDMSDIAEYALNQFIERSSQYESVIKIREIEDNANVNNTAR